ncbi:MAG: cyclic nucleotide-binding domain-containing protein [Acidobacteriota bacterium]
MFNWRKPQDLNDLLAKRQYGKAIQLLEAQVADEPDSVFLRQRLADVLELDGRPDRAVATLFDLVDHFAREGFVSKGLAILKKIQRIDPDADINDRLQQLMSQTSGSAPRVTIPSPRPPAPSTPAVDPWDRPPVVADPGRPHLSEGDDESSPSGVPYFTSELVRSEIWLQDADHRDDFHWSPLFAGFPKRALAKFFAGMHLRVKTPGSIIITEGEPADGLYVLASGTARVYRRDERGSNRQVRIIQGGTFFGIDGLLEGEPRRRTAVAATSCELLQIGRYLFLQLADEHPEIRERVERLRAESG